MFANCLRNLCARRAGQFRLMLQKLQIGNDRRPAQPSPDNSELLSSRLIDELKRAIAPVAESADVTAALVTATKIVWLTERRPCSCAPREAVLSARPAPPCADGHGLLTSPMLCEGQYLGDLTICNPIEQPYLAGVIQYLARAAVGRIAYERREASLQAAMIIENERLQQTAVASERLRQQIEIGSKIQQSLLVGHMPEGISGLNVFVFTLPSQEIDGDFYDFIKHSNECLDVLVGDVMGKGIPAALLGAATKNSFLRATSRVSSAAGRPGVLASPEEIVNLVHQDMTRQLIELDNFATACYARFDIEAQQVAIVDCGHTRTIRYWRRKELCGVLAGNNMPLGFSEGEIYKQFSVPLEPGDIFLFYSDGVTEARNHDGELFGEERLARCVLDYHHLQPQPLIAAIRHDVMAFADSERFSDDFTLLAVRVAGGEAEVICEALEITSDLAELTRARAFICSLCDKLSFLPLTEETVNHLQLAVTEALSNIVRHAYRGRPDRPIQIEATADAHHIGLRLYHHGEMFDPKSASPPSLDGSQEGGFGLYIIEQLVDELSYGRDERGRACTYLVKRFH